MSSDLSVACPFLQFVTIVFALDAQATVSVLSSLP